MSAAPMTPDQVLAVVQSAVATVLELDPDSVGRETRFRADLQADSLALVEIVEIVEETLAPLARSGFHIDDEDLDALTTVGEAVDYAVSRL
ncbi:MAG: acyl carrier protein [Actinobacteria bacterium]|jgi:acyl carrier protein|nr:acyl carrier protein [Actinomycetota bacterium]MBW3647884.1 acyl carrier protein [Actinomycetota bacterium]